jgi:hypothetical protein
VTEADKPAIWIKEAIEESQRLRGWITNGYAQIEFLLGDLILRCREFPAYAENTVSIPYGGKDRAKRVLLLLANSGPLDVFAAELNNVIIAFDRQHENRNLLAHGFSQFMYNSKKECWLDFRKLHRDKTVDNGLLVKQFTLSDLKQEKEETALIAQTAMVLFRDIHSYFGWNK